MALERYRAAAAELAAGEASLLAAQSECTTAKEDKIRVLAEYKRVEEQTAQLQGTLNGFQKEQEETGQRLTLLRAAAQEAGEQRERLTLQKGQKEEQLAAVTGGQDDLSARREELSSQNAAKRMEIMALQKEIESVAEARQAIQKRREDSTGRAEALRAEITHYEEQNRLQEQKIEELNRTIGQLREQARQASEAIEQLAGKRGEAEQRAAQLRTGERDKTGEREKLSVELARLQERRDVMAREVDEVIARLYDEYELTRSEAEQMGIVIEDPQKAARELTAIRNKIKALGSVNVAAIEEYKEVYERYSFLSEQIADVEKSKGELGRLIGQLTDNMEQLFSEKFHLINGHFAHTFSELFGGGVAELKLSNPQDVLESGIDIRVQPPGKNVSSIEQLSGGEKSLVAIAIYFAMMKVAPPPFCMLDEVESALDDINVDRFAGYLRRMSGKTQFIVVTHRRGSMEEADVLYGVTMQEKGVSKILELNVNEVEKKLNLPQS